MVSIREFDKGMTEALNETIDNKEIISVKAEYT